MYSVAGVLSGLCIGLLVAVVILHIRDKVRIAKHEVFVSQLFCYSGLIERKEKLQDRSFILMLCSNKKLTFLHLGI